MVLISLESIVPPPSPSNTLNTQFNLSSGELRLAVLIKFYLCRHLRLVALIANMYSWKSMFPLWSSSNTLEKRMLDYSRLLSRQFVGLFSLQNVTWKEHQRETQPYPQAPWLNIKYGKLNHWTIQTFTKVKVGERPHNMFMRDTTSCLWQYFLLFQTKQTCLESSTNFFLLICPFGHSSMNCSCWARTLKVGIVSIFFTICHFVLHQWMNLSADT